MVSNADRPKGRSGRPQPTDVSALAEQHGLPLLRFESLKDSEAVATLAAFHVELFLVFAYGKILPAAIFELPPQGTINLHASLLPALRGAAPIQSAILNGLDRTGWTVQFIAAKMDAGDIISQCEVAIGPDDTTEELSARMLPEGIRLVMDTLDRWNEYKTRRAEQRHDQATYCKKIEPEDARLDWSLPAAELHNRVRAFAPRPLAWTLNQGARLKIFRTRPLSPSESARVLADAALPGTKIPPPGTVVVAREGKIFKMLVVTGRGLLEIFQLQPENRKSMAASDFINGSRMRSGAILGTPLP